MNERFWSKVSKTDGCWLWNGYLNAKGYGNYSLHKRSRLAHRLAYEELVGPIPAGLCVLHRCDNPRCVNPAHLFLGTLADNNADMFAKGRGALGETNGQARLDYVKAAAIKVAPGYHKQIAAQFGVSQSTVTRIKNGQIWKESPGA